MSLIEVIANCTTEVGIMAANDGCLRLGKCKMLWSNLPTTGRACCASGTRRVRNRKKARHMPISHAFARVQTSS